MTKSTVLLFLTVLLINKPPPFLVFRAGVGGWITNKPPVMFPVGISFFSDEGR